MCCVFAWLMRLTTSLSANTVHLIPDIEPVFNEVHRSNMTKKGGYKNDYGKWIKPKSYSHAEIEPIIKKQINGI